MWQSVRVPRNMAHDAENLLAGVIVFRLRHVRVLHALCVDDAKGCLFLSPSPEVLLPDLIFLMLAPAGLIRLALLAGPISRSHNAVWSSPGSHREWCRFTRYHRAYESPLAEAYRQMLRHRVSQSRLPALEAGHPARMDRQCLHLQLRRCPSILTAD
jgi:hypothetical protein